MSGDGGRVSGVGGRGGGDFVFYAEGVRFEDIKRFLPGLGWVDIRAVGEMGWGGGEIHSWESLRISAGEGA